MSKNFLKPLFLMPCFFSVLQCFSQSVIDYQNWTPPSSCNIFGSSISINNFPHKSMKGQPVYNSINGAVLLKTIPDGAPGIGTEYRITYNFAQGYKYKVIINAMSANSATTSNCTLSPVPQNQPVHLGINPNNSTLSGNSDCNGPQGINLPVTNFQMFNWQSINTTGFTDYTFESSSFPESYQYLTVAGERSYIDDCFSYQDILIRKITIIKEAYGLSPESINFCGNTAPRTFTINDQSLIGSGFSYNWTIGSGWLLNGSAAPSTFTTTDPSIQLTPASSSQAPGNVSVSVVNGGTVFNTFTSTVNPVTSPSSPTITAVKTNAIGEPTDYHYTATVIPGATYDWYSYTHGSTSGPVLRQSSSWNQFDMYHQCNKTIDVWCVVSNVCGTATSNTITRTGECIRTQHFILSPNPASSDLTVSTIAASKEGTLTEQQITEVRIYDQQGTLKKQRKFSSVKQAHLNISDLPTGTYVIEIRNGNYKEQKQLLVQK